MLFPMMIMKINLSAVSLNPNKNKNKLLNVIIESNVKHDIISRLCVDWFLKRIGRDLLNKLVRYYVVMEKVVDKKELMRCTRGKLVIYVHSSKDFEIV